MDDDVYDLLHALHGRVMMLEARVAYLEDKQHGRTNHNTEVNPKENPRATPQRYALSADS